jgi:hypothetical protein
MWCGIPWCRELLRLMKSLKLAVASHDITRALLI